jgi:hypothetical protein
LSVDSLAAVGNTGSGLPFSFQGEEYVLHKLTDELRAKYTSWIRREAIRLTYEQKSAYPSEEEFQSQLARVQKDINSHVYDFGTKASREVGNSEAGSIAFFRVLFDNPKANESVVRAMLTAHGKELQTLFETLHPEAKEAATFTEGDAAPKA